MKFQVFKNGEVNNDFKLVGAYAFSTDGIAIRQAEFSFKDGIVECKKTNLSTSGIALLWQVEGFGKVLLPTTCLPERPEPYILNLEIARAKLMQIITTSEEWSFFNDFAQADETSRDARNHFIEAIQNISDPAKASVLADKALKKALVYAEQMTMECADQLVKARAKNRGFGRGYLGCEIDPDQVQNQQFVEKLIKVFGVVSININWKDIEKEPDHYDFSHIDKCLEVVSKKKLAVAAGPLICFSPAYLPKWLSDYDFESIREAAFEFISKIVSRYAGTIRPWKIISGLNYYNCFGFNFEQVLEMTRAVIMAAKAANPRAIKIIEIVNPWGEYYGGGKEAIPPMVYADMILQSGMSFDAFGLSLRFGCNKEGMHVRDMMQISTMLDRLALSGKPMGITSLEIPSQPTSDNSDAGQWHKPWDQDVQMLWLEQFYKIALSKASLETIFYSHLADTKTCTVPHSGLLTAKLEEKKSFKALTKMHKTIFSKPGSKNSSK